MPKLDLLYTLPLLLYTLKIALHNLSILMRGNKEEPIYIGLGYICASLSYLIYFLFVLLIISNAILIFNEYYRLDRIVSVVIFGSIIIIDEWSRKSESVKQKNEIQQLIRKLENALTMLCDERDIELTQNYSSAFSKDKYSIGLENAQETKNKYETVMKTLKLSKKEFNKLQAIAYGDTDFEGYTEDEIDRITEAYNVSNSLEKLKKREDLEGLVLIINQYYRGLF